MILGHIKQGRYICYPFRALDWHLVLPSTTGYLPNNNDLCGAIAEELQQRFVVARNRVLSNSDDSTDTSQRHGRIRRGT